MREVDKKLQRMVIETIPEKLKFGQLILCRRCGWCCRTCNPFILAPELDNICRYLNIDVDTFGRKYAKNYQDNSDGIILKNPCPFLDDKNNCIIYPIRPLSCALFPFSATLLVIKPCKKGLEMYNILEKWYEDHGKYDNYSDIKFKLAENIMKDFYFRQFPSIEYMDDNKKQMELEDILKNDEIKAHGITIIPSKEDLKKICKYLKKQTNTPKICQMRISNG
jgi:Fe-S-cluster containining protein